MKFSKEQIAEWKAKHGELIQVDVDDKSCILHTPKRKDLSYASVVKDPMKLNETLLRQLWVAGDEEIQTDDSLFLAVCNKMDEILKVKEATVKKL